MINYERVRTIKRIIYIVLAVVFFAPAVLAIILFFQLQGLKNELYESNADRDVLAAEIRQMMEGYQSPARQESDFVLPQAPEVSYPEDYTDLQDNDSTDIEDAEESIPDGVDIPESSPAASAGAAGNPEGASSIEGEIISTAPPAQNATAPPATGTNSAGISNPATGTEY